MNEWKIDEEYGKKVRADISSDKALDSKWPSFERDVVSNPFFHPKANRIVKLKDSTYPEGTYRYRKDPLRVVYFPKKEERVVYPIAASSAANAPYKKRSKR